MRMYFQQDHGRHKAGACVCWCEQEPHVKALLVAKLLGPNPPKLPKTVAGEPEKPKAKE